MDISSIYQATSSNGSGSGDADSALGKISQDFDMFLTLLTTQLQNQDPMDPMDNTEMTNQLVNFANVEQQITQNKNLEQLIGLQKASASSAAVGYIGKDVQMDGDTTHYAGNAVTFGYIPKAGATTLSINVVNENGDIVRTLEGESSAQRHTVEWDGTDADGDPVPEGAYRFLVNALDAEQESVQMADTDITGRVTGSASDDNGVYVLLENLAVSLDRVISVREPSEA